MRIISVLVFGLCISIITGMVQAETPSVRSSAERHQWGGTIDDINLSEGRIIVYDRLFSINSYTPVYTSDGKTLVPVSELKQGMKVDCYLENQSHIQKLVIQK